MYCTIYNYNLCKYTCTCNCTCKNVQTAHKTTIVYLNYNLNMNSMVIKEVRGFVMLGTQWLARWICYI